MPENRLRKRLGIGFRFWSTGLMYNIDKKATYHKSHLITSKLIKESKIKIQQSNGITPTEKHLVSLCRRTFHSICVWPNLYREPGTELCDVLVVSRNDIIIFSDKSSENYPNTGNEDKDWKRWFERIIKKSADQIYGAERWLRNHPNRIYTDPKCNNRFPLDLPSSKLLRVHRVAVARGAGQRCSSFFGGDSGSLFLRNDVSGDQIFDPPKGIYSPFAIGHINPDKGYIHVLDDENLDIVFTELDTVTDFVAYLICKEAFMCSNKTIYASGEEDILAYYLTHIKEDGQHDFIVSPDATEVVFCDLYRKWQNYRSYNEKKKADKISYRIDRLIEHFGNNIIHRTLLEGNDIPIQYLFQAVLTLASEDRLARRMLAKSLVEFEFLTKAPTQIRSRCSVKKVKPVNGYCFLAVSASQWIDYEEYCQIRSERLFDYCTVMKLKFPTLQHVVGYAFEPLREKQRSQSLAYLNVTNWTEEDARQAHKKQVQLEFFVSPKIIRMRDYEYPNRYNSN